MRSIDCHVSAGFITAILMFALFCVFVILGFLYGRADNAQLADTEGDNLSSSARAVRYFRQNTVQLAVVPVAMPDKPDTVAFNIALNDPEAVLSRQNWLHLEDGKGNELEPIKVNQTAEGYVVAFSVVKRPPLLKLSIDGAGEFVW